MSFFKETMVFQEIAKRQKLLCYGRMCQAHEFLGAAHEFLGAAHEFWGAAHKIGGLSQEIPASIHSVL